MDEAKQPLSAALAGPYGHPFHPLLVTVPIGAWVAALVFDLASHLVTDADFLAKGALWLVAIGVLDHPVRCRVCSTCSASLAGLAPSAPGSCT